jgi:hypothetical protein
MPKGFKIFVGIMLSLLVLLQAATLAFFVYGAIKVKQETSQVRQTVNHKVDKFTDSTSGINHKLKGIKSEVKQQKSRYGF